MRHEIRISGQRGVVLVISLLLLFVLLVIGAAGFSNTHLQERSAANARLQAEAFKAASAGAVDSLNFFFDVRDGDIATESPTYPDEDCGSLGHLGWVDGDGNPVPTGWYSHGTPIGEATLRQRLYCLADQYPCVAGEDPSECGFRPPRSQLFVLSRGEVTVNGKVVASRDIEVRIKKGQDGYPGEGCGAICFPQCGMDLMDWPNSNAFQVDGNGGPAITAPENCEAGEGLDAIRDAIRDNRIGNYGGENGLQESGGSEPWDLPANTELFRAQVAALAFQAQEAGCGNCYHDNTGLNDSGNTTYGTNESPQITYVDGNADLGGNVSGAGIMFVNGNLAWDGTPNYRGLIVALGGSFHLDGGGRGGTPGDFDMDKGGTIVILNAPGDGTFGEASFENTGGGTGFWRHDCGWLWKAHNLLVQGLGGDENAPLWEPDCTEEEDLWYLGPERLIIASWRENIGWREELFAD